jgi:hypothetical protein
MKSAEVAVAALFIAFGAVVIADSVRLGFRWVEDGPQPGYFPFYVGLIICAAGLVNLVRGLLLPAAKNGAFVEVGQLKLVLSVLVPTAVYAALIGWIGIYVASIVFIAYFMRRLGRYAWWKTAAVSIGNSVVFFVIFEVWFKIPLPKGPVEAFLRIH